MIHKLSRTMLVLSTAVVVRGVAHALVHGPQVLHARTAKPSPQHTPLLVLSPCLLGGCRSR